jgi:hypothetical protein
MIQLTQMRFFYGFNVVVTPLFVIISAMWWKTSEQPLRIGIWIAGASIGSIIGQAIDFGAVNIGGEYETIHGNGSTLFSVPCPLGSDFSTSWSSLILR